MPELVARTRGRRRASHRHRCVQGGARPRSSRNASPAAAGLTRATTPCWPPNRAPTTSCSASRTRWPPPAFDAVLERVAWWAEIFDDPVRRLCGEPRRGRGACAQAGADFVAIGETSGAAARRRRGGGAAPRASRSRCDDAPRCPSVLRSRRRLLAARRARAADADHAAGRRGRRRAFRQSRAKPKPSQSQRTSPAAKPAPKKSIARQACGSRAPTPPADPSTPTAFAPETAPARAVRRAGEAGRAVAADRSRPRLQPQPQPARRAMSRSALTSAATISRPSRKPRAAPANRAIRSR